MSNYNLGYLCYIWNQATAPNKLRTEAGHKAAAKLARKVLRLIKKHPNYCLVQERSNGSLSI